MKKLFVLFIILVPGALCLNVSSQHQPGPFEVKVTGKGKKAILFIPGLACSGEVWEETAQHFKDDYTCYILTMAGFAGVRCSVIFMIILLTPPPVNTMQYAATTVRPTASHNLFR